VVAEVGAAAVRVGMASRRAKVCNVTTRSPTTQQSSTDARPTVCRTRCAIRHRREEHRPITTRSPNIAVGGTKSVGVVGKCVPRVCVCVSGRRLQQQHAQAQRFVVCDSVRLPSPSRQHHQHPSVRERGSAVGSGGLRRQVEMWYNGAAQQGRSGAGGGERPFPWGR